MMCDLPKNKTIKEIDELVEKKIYNINENSKLQDIESIINIMSVTSLQEDQLNVLKNKIEAAKHNINLSNDESQACLDKTKEIKEKEESIEKCQFALDQKVLSYGKKEEIPSSKFTGKVLITFTEQKLAQECIEK